MTAHEPRANSTAPASASLRHPDRKTRDIAVAGYRSSYMKRDLTGYGQILNTTRPFPPSSRLRPNLIDPSCSRPAETNDGALGALRRRGFAIGGQCLDCRRLFSVILDGLIAERGADCIIRTIAPLVCPTCQGSRAQKSIYFGDPPWEGLS